MAIIRLILAESPAKQLTQPVKQLWQPSLFASAELERVYFPFRGLPHSAVVHIIAFIIVYFFVPFPKALPQEPVPQEKIVMIDLNDPMSMMFLPMFDGGKTQAGAPAKPAASGQAKIAKPAAKTVKSAKPEPVAASKPEPAPPEPPSTTTQGFSYPGPQPIISDVERATNRFQTILQPDLENPPILKPPLAIPNIVQLANAITVPRMMEPPPPPEPDEPQPEKAAPKPAEPPKPEPKPAVAPKPEPKHPEPAPKPVATPKPEPKPVGMPKPEPKAAVIPKPEVKPPEPAPKPVVTPKPEPKPVEMPKPEPKPEVVPKPEPKLPEPAPKPVITPNLEPKPVEMPKPEPKPEVIPKPEPKPPEPPPKPIEPTKTAEVPKPEPKPTIAPKPEPAPKPVETPNPAETPKPEPKTVEPPKPAPAAAAAAKPEPQLPKPEAKTTATPPKSAPTTVSTANNAEALASAAQKTTEPSKESIEYSATPGAPLDLITLSPMPAAPGQPASIPLGEARGRFVISPDPNLNGSDAEPGFKTGTPSPKVGIGNTTGAPARKGAAPKAEGSAAAKTGSASGSASGKAAPGTGAGGSSARTAGAGSGTATAAGNGSGSAPAKKPFAGITIVGGDYEPGSDADVPPVTKAVKPLQTAYGLNIISTEDSGGGLPFFGVFSHEQIYTVYLDMRTVEADQDPSWTFEFAIMQDSSSSSAVRDLSRSQQGLVLPFPSAKEKPAWPAGLVRKYPGKMIIVYGMINAEGKMEQISVKDSPDPLLNEPVIKALGKWTFKPAQSEGQPVPAKALFGIPLWAPE